jgi:hypothetical protein
VKPKTDTVNTITSTKNDMEISKEAIERANLCSKNKACLRENGENCPVVSEIASGPIIVIKKKAEPCYYYTHFGYNGFCKCPVRKEVYRKYKK